MNAEMYPIRVETLRGLVTGEPELVEFAARSDPLLIAKLGDIVLGFVGFLPATALSDCAYAWVHVTPTGNCHKTTIAKLARRWMPIIHSRYKKLAAHCIMCPRHLRWVQSIVGGKFTMEQNGLMHYTIEEPGHG